MHECSPDPKFNNSYLVWLVRWVHRADHWRLYKICDKCAANPLCEPQLLISQGSDVVVNHVLYHISGDSPIGRCDDVYFQLDTGIITGSWWEVVSVRKINGKSVAKFDSIVDEKVCGVA